MEFIARTLAWWEMRRNVKRLDQLIQRYEREDADLRARIDRKKYPLLEKFMDRSDQLPQLRAMRELSARTAHSWAPWRSW